MVVTGTEGNPLVYLARFFGAKMHPLRDSCRIYDRNGTVCPPGLSAALLHLILRARFSACLQVSRWTMHWTLRPKKALTSCWTPPPCRRTSTPQSGATTRLVPCQGPLAPRMRHLQVIEASLFLF
jgi:hypothetical protein